MHKQIQIAPGVYVTDFRKDGNLIGLGEENVKKQLTNDVGLLLDQVNSLESKINQLQYSIEEIQKEDNWQNDGDFVEAIEQNWECIVKFSYEMKEKVLRLYELQYHPESQKIQQLLKIHRIEQRQAKAIEQVKKNIAKLAEKTKALTGRNEDKKLVKVSDQQSDKQEQQKEKKQQDGGVFV